MCELNGKLLVDVDDCWDGSGTAEIMADEADPLRKINPFVASMKPSGTGFISDLAKTLKAEGR